MLLAYREDRFVLCGGAKSGGSPSNGSALRGAGALKAAGAGGDSRSARPSKPVITPEAKLVGVAGVRQGQEHGHELDDAALARHAREHGPTAGHECLARLVQGTVCKFSAGKSMRKVRYYLERRCRFEQKMAQEFAVCVYREGQVLKRAAIKSRKNHQASGDRLPTTKSRNPGRRNDSPRFAAQKARRPRDLRAGLRVQKRRGTLSLLAGIDLLTGRSMRSSGTLPQPGVYRIPQRLDAAYPASTTIKLILDNHSAHRESKSLARGSTAWTLRIYLHAQAWFLAPISITRASSQIRPVGLAPHPRHLKTRTQRTHYGRHRRRQSPPRHLPWSYKLADAA